MFDRAPRELRGLGTPEAQYAQRILPCTALGSQRAFYRWRDGFGVFCLLALRNARDWRRGEDIRLQELQDPDNPRSSTSESLR